MTIYIHNQLSTATDANCNHWLMTVRRLSCRLTRSLAPHWTRTLYTMAKLKWKSLRECIHTYIRVYVRREKEIQTRQRRREKCNVCQRNGIIVASDFDWSVYSVRRNDVCDVYANVKRTYEKSGDHLIVGLSAFYFWILIYVYVVISSNEILIDGI